MTYGQHESLKPLLVLWLLFFGMAYRCRVKHDSPAGEQDHGHLEDPYFIQQEERERFILDGRTKGRILMDFKLQFLKHLRILRK